jgi:uncharacterized protein
MKLSNYNVKLDVDNNYAIYNTVSRKYVLYDDSKKEYIDSILNNINKDKYEINEGEILKKFIKNGIIIEDNLDESEKVTYLFNKTKYQDRRFILIVSPTLDCNFRCPYCFEERKNSYISDEVIKDLIDFVKKISKEVNTLQVGWFGGEPMLQFEKIKKMTKIFKEICENEGCNYCSTMTTNGYLFNDERINDLDDFNMKRIQITLDGDREFHNKKRPLADGSGTFDKILENINKIVDKDIPLYLRINVDKDNAESIPKLFDLIPENKREKIIVNMCNIFQNKEDVNLFPLYQIAIDMGFSFKFSRKQFQICEGSFINSITVQPDGIITPCQMCSERGFDFGSIGKDGRLLLKNESEFYKFRSTSALDNEKCKECNRLPLCLGGCYFKRYKDNTVCVATHKGGKEFWDIIKLEIYSDIKHNLVKELNII